MTITVTGNIHPRTTEAGQKIGGTTVPGKKSPGPSIKKPKTYEALRDKGMSKKRAAKISNAQADKQASRSK